MGGETLFLVASQMYQNAPKRAILKQNKCIVDDTKAAVRQNPNCIKKTKIWQKTIFNIADGIITPCNVARS